MLRANVYKPYRNNLAKAMKACEVAGTEGELTPDLINDVTKAVAAIDQAFQDNAKYGDPGLAEAKALVEGAPKLLLEGANKADSDAAAKKIEEAGGKVELK